MTDQTYIEALEQSAEHIDDCIAMLIHAAGDQVIDNAIQHLRLAAGHIMCALADENMEQARMAVEHMREAV